MSLEKNSVKEMIYKEASTKSKKDDPFRTTKTVAVTNLFDNALDNVVDAGTMAAGFVLGSKLDGVKGFKNKMKVLKNVRPRHIREALSSPQAKEAFKLFKNQQKLMIPIGLGISTAYTGVALRNDFKHRKKTAFENVKDGIYKVAFDGKGTVKSPIECMFGTENETQLKAAWRNISRLEITEGDKIKLRQDLLRKAKLIGVNVKGWSKEV